MAAMSDELAFDDVQILKLESAAILGHTCKVVVIEPDDDGRPLDPDQLRERIAERLDAVPRLRDRVAMPARGNPCWEGDGDFDLANHVVATRGEPLTDDELRGAIGELMAQRLDHERPLWRLDLLPMTDSRVAVVTRMHHCMVDGVAAMRVLAAILWDPIEAAPAKQKHRTVGLGACGPPREFRERFAGSCARGRTRRSTGISARLARSPGPRRPWRS